MSLASAPFHEGCANCGTHFAIDLPDELVQAARDRQLVVFAGAGISTEAPGRFPETLYEEIEARLRDTPSNSPFPEVMQEFVDRFGRRELVKTILERIDYVSTFLSLLNTTTSFHHEIATIAQLDAIFTTNWDTFFEQYSGARSFVLDEDFAFFDLPGRRVMKVHGSITNLSTLVATSDDYRAREDDLRDSLMGAKLREFLSTRTIVFVGYSLTDSDFQSIYRSVLQRMGAFRPKAYIVTPVESLAAGEFGLEHLQTDGGHFAHLLKAKLEETKQHVPDANLERAAMLRDIVLSAHGPSESLQAEEELLGAYTLAYQDGLLAAFGRIALLAHKGEYSDPRKVESVLHTYAHLLTRAVQLRRHFDAAYIEGYLIATMSLLLSDEQCMSIPIVQTFGSPAFRARNANPHLDLDEPWWLNTATATLSEYTKEWNKARAAPVDWLTATARASSRRARRTPGLSSENRQLLNSLGEGQVVQHSEFLDGVE